MKLEDARSTSLAVWEEISSKWGRDSDYIWQVSRQVSEWMLERAQPRPGETILEIAAGSGDTGFAAAGLAGPNARLISTDFSKGMVDAARARAEARGVANVDFRVMDAENMDLQDASVDIVLCRWGYMLMLDPQRALTETNRVLRPGGRLAASVWGEPARNPWATVVGKVFVAIDRPPSSDPKGPGGLFSMSDPALIHSMLQQASFANIDLDEVPVTWRFKDFDALWTFYTEVAGAVAPAINALETEVRKRFRKTLQQAVEDHRGDAGYELAGMCLNFLAS